MKQRPPLQLDFGLDLLGPIQTYIMFQRSKKHRRVLNHAQNTVASVTQKTTNYSRSVVMINAEPPLSPFVYFVATANGATVSLLLQEGIVLLNRHAILPGQRGVVFMPTGVFPLRMTETTVSGTFGSGVVISQPVFFAELCFHSHNDTIVPKLNKVPWDYLKYLLTA